jgi:cell division protein FtsA
VSRQIICEILEPRTDEILGLVQREIMKSGLESSLAAGVVLTGGCTLLEGMVELAEEIFSLPVRKGIPLHIQGLVDILSNPMYATAIGLVLYGEQRRAEREGKWGPRVIGRLREGVVQWLREFF